MVVCFSEDLGTGLKADTGPGNDFANRYFSRSQQKNKGGVRNSEERVKRGMTEC